MLTAWRIVRRKRAGSAFSGQGAARYGGRWNSRGSGVVYASSSISLTALETLVHLNPPFVFHYVLFSMRFSPALVEEIALRNLPAHWRQEPPGPSTKKIGDVWLTEGRSAVLRVPSAIVPAENNYLINPEHPDFSKIQISRPERFVFDPRLLA